MSSLSEFFLSVADDIDKELDKLIDRQLLPAQILRDAVRWSVFAGGKRFRPALVIAVGEAFGAQRSKLLQTAAAVEMLHTYSLIHDDLPSMDDDDLRRGRATCHRKFGESTAILAGDALQAMAFHSIASDTKLDTRSRLELVEGLGAAAAQMVTGQQLDLEAEGKELSVDDVRRIHANKTGALIVFSAVAGARIGMAEVSEVEAVQKFGSHLGVLFQITDDLLDVTESTDSLGKTAGKDAVAKKASYPNVVGLDRSRDLAEKEAQTAIDALAGLARPTATLEGFVRYLLERTS